MRVSIPGGARIEHILVPEAHMRPNIGLRDDEEEKLPSQGPRCWKDNAPKGGCRFGAERREAARGSVVGVITRGATRP